MKLQELNEQELQATNGGLLGGLLGSTPLAGGIQIGNLLGVAINTEDDRLDIGLSVNLGGLNLGGGNLLGGLTNLLGGLLGGLRL